MNLVNWIEFQSLGDARGSLVAIEIGLEKSIPFEIKRVYYIYRTESGVTRGHHAHKKLRQVAICMNGKCRVVLDNGKSREEVWLKSPTEGLLIEEMTWRELYDFSDDCVLLLLASEHYDESDYIRDYDRFLEELNR
ncbi:MAG: dTDP-6-deoxy-3,4-keto-hexulose isomerase [Oceanospirillaceae bacterium]|nr:dTDP-6-deoxy-3,4-keto-hexulose isomerase [Oceanospirillaceae bacterium]